MKFSAEIRRVKEQKGGQLWFKIASFECLDYAKWFAVHAPLPEVQIVENWPRRRILVIYKHGEPDREAK